MNIDEFFEITEFKGKIDEKKRQEIIGLKKDMQEAIIKIDNFPDRFEYVTFVINNIFNIINDKKILTFLEYKALNGKARRCGKKLKKVKQVKKYNKFSICKN